MSVAVETVFDLGNSFAEQLEGLYVPWQGAPVAAPRLLALNEPLARELGAEPEALRTTEGVAVLAGAAAPAGSTPIAQAYSGHQFGGFVPILGDGRALLVGELIDREGSRRDLHLKGSGRTPFGRSGDGKAAVGPMLREYLIGEAMHALGIPTSRALAVVATGEQVIRGTSLPGAVLSRIAASHIRVGTFQYAAIHKDPGLLRRLADYTIARHYPDAADAEDPYLALLEAAIEAQAALIARWVGVGFIHGVMNTDNMAIAGETIDYGPCAFIEGYDPATVFSSIDHGGRYAFGNQPRVAQWNLARLAEPLLSLLQADTEADTEAAIAGVTALLETFPHRYEQHRLRVMRDKLGLAGEQSGDRELVDDLLEILRAEGADFTVSFRALAGSLRGEQEGVQSLFENRPAYEGWSARWRKRLGGDGANLAIAAAAMDAVNPIYIPRNHLVEEALRAANAGELSPFERLLELVTSPFEERPGLDEYASPAPASFGAYVTYCGT